MADIAHAKTDKNLEEMEKRLSAIYSRANKEIGKRWKEYLSESQAEIDELQKAYELAKKGGDAKEIKKAGIALSRAKKDRTLMDSRFKALTETTAAQLANVNKTALAYINGQLPEVYSINYNALEPSVDGVGGYSFALVDADTVKNLAITDKSLLPFKELDEKKDIRWNVKKMNAEVLQGILQGEPMDKIAGRLSKVADMNETAAIRNARTMVTSAENKGRQDSYARAEADGIILQKEWISTNDRRTRHSHAALDGAIVDQDKKFDNGLMFPGDPNGRPEETWNCRCTVAAVVKGFKKAQVQKAMEEKHEEQHTMQVKTKAEAETVAKQFGVDADYSKYDISVANAINETMQEYVDIFGTHAFDNLNEISSFAKGEKIHEWGGYSSKGKSIKIRGVSSKDAIEKFGKTMQKYVDGYFSTGSNLHIIRHELGHSVHDVVDGTVYSELMKYRRSVSLQISKDVSFRADWDDYEFVAECLAQYLNGNPSKIAIDVVEILKKGFKYKFG